LAPGDIANRVFVNTFCLEWGHSFRLVNENRVRRMVFNVTINNIAVISCLSALLVKETGVSGENHRRPATSHW